MEADRSTLLMLFLFMAMIPIDLLASNISTVISYQSSVSRDKNGPLDLYAELNYCIDHNNAPIAVVMHGYSPVSWSVNGVRANAQRLRDVGFFAISVSLRGRDGSDGIRDSGGVEIYDIYDAVEYVKSHFSAYVDPTNIHITGYSGGGGNVLSALTKFPDYFRAGSAYFGMSDYGYDLQTGWYFLGASSGHRKQLRSDVGDPSIGDPAIRDRYAARASYLASHNNPYSEIHLFVNQNELTCPPINDENFLKNATSHQKYLGEFKNIQLHIGGKGEYIDFNNDHINQSDELQDWPHGFPTAEQQHAAESWYLDRLLKGVIPQPVLRLSDEFYVAGYVKTKFFSLWIGDGQNAAGVLQYCFTSNYLKSFSLQLVTNDKTIISVLKVDTSDMTGKQVKVWTNSVETDEFVGGNIYTISNLRDGDTAKLESMPNSNIKIP